MFYSINNLSKAVYLTLYPNLTLANSHGISMSCDPDTFVSLGGLEVSFNKKGTFSNLLYVTHDNLLAGEKIKLVDIFSIIPELIEIYHMRFQKSPRVFLTQKIRDFSYKLFVREDDVLNNNLIDDFKILNKYGLHISIPFDNYYFIYLDANYLKKYYDKCFVSDIYGNEYCSLGIEINGQHKIISKITSLYICYYAFSMLVRYHPDIWMKICESADTAIVRKLLSYCRKEMLVEVLQKLNNEEYSFATKLDSNFVLDSREIYEMVKDEMKREKKAYNISKGIW